MTRPFRSRARRRRTPGRAARFGPLALLAAGASACGSAGEAGEAERPRVRVTTSRYFYNAPLLLAREEGFFADEGLDVRFVDQIGNSTQMMPALAQGRLEVISSGVSTGFFNAIAHGAPVRIVADRGSYAVDGCTSTGVVARRGLVEPGAELRAEDVRGRIVAVNSPSSSSVYFLEALLDSLSLKREDVRTEEIPNAASLEALNNGAVDFIAVIEPQLTQLTSAGHPLVVPNERILPGFHSGAVMFGRTLLEEDREAGRRFIRAYLRAVRRYNEGKTERNLEVLSRSTGLPRETLERMCWPALREDGRIDAGSLVSFQEWSHRKGYLDRVVPAEGFWDPEFVEAATADLAGQP